MSACRSFPGIILVHSFLMKKTWQENWAGTETKLSMKTGQELKQNLVGKLGRNLYKTWYKNWAGTETKLGRKFGQELKQIKHENWTGPETSFTQLFLDSDLECIKSVD